MRVWLRKILDGHRGALPFLLRCLLAPLGIIYGVIGVIRYRLYQSFWFQRHTPALPVISVGNLTAGGTGKTPFVITLCRLLAALNRRPAVLTRGYGASNPNLADEVLLYRELLPGVDVFADRDRSRGAYQAQIRGANVLVLDDGFQHLPLTRNLDIVMLDAAAPFSSGLPLPAGMLREFPSALRRADIIVVSRSDQVSSGRLEILKEKIRDYCGEIPVLIGMHRPSRLANLNGAPIPLTELTGKKVVAISGIGRPDAFASTLRDLGAEVCETLEFSDHHIYQAEKFTTQLGRCNRDYLPITTEKDAVKLRQILDERWRERILMLGIDFRTAGLPLLRSRLERIFSDSPSA